ncbi:hypothetical protein BJX99DRAFT_219638 [Aspergillus californicus]
MRHHIPAFCAIRLSILTQGARLPSSLRSSLNLNKNRIAGLLPLNPHQHSRLRLPQRARIHPARRNPKASNNKYLRANALRASIRQYVLHNAKRRSGTICFPAGKRPARADRQPGLQGCACGVASPRGVLCV